MRCRADEVRTIGNDFYRFVCEYTLINELTWTQEIWPPREGAVADRRLGELIQLGSRTLLPSNAGFHPPFATSLTEGGRGTMPCRQSAHYLKYLRSFSLRTHIGNPQSACADSSFAKGAFKGAVTKASF